MKYLILTVFCAGVALGAAYYAGRAKGPVSVGVAATDLPNQPVNSPPRQSEQPSEVARTATPPPVRPPNPPSNTVVAPEQAAMDPSMVLGAVEVLLSPQSAYEQKQSTWKQLRQNHALDLAIEELQQRFASNPSSAQCAAVLGEAYLQKCGTISDVRDQGMLAMQADKLFDTALSQDPQNWDARFTKAVALSYWPASMGKTDEVIQHFLTLVQQQETQAPQPQFAQTYVWLGDQYQKAGRLDDAKSVWARGAALYPSESKLQARLASAP